jgi:hypothetical protein
MLAVGDLRAGPTQILVQDIPVSRQESVDLVLMTLVRLHGERGRRVRI